MKKLLIGMFLLSASPPALAEKATAAMYCELAVRAGEAGALRGYSDKMIEQSLCILAKESATGINGGDTRKFAYCITGTRYFLREFERRFPGRDSETVIGKC